MFYFIYQLKLEMIPYVAKEIEEFLRYFEEKLSDIYQAKTSEQVQSNGAASLELQKKHKLILNLFTILKRKKKQVDDFHYANWMDFRANLILPSKNKLQEFLIKQQARYQKAFQPESFPQADKEAPQSIESPARITVNERQNKRVKLNSSSPKLDDNSVEKQKQIMKDQSLKDSQKTNGKMGKSALKSKSHSKSNSSFKGLNQKLKKSPDKKPSTEVKSPNTLKVDSGQKTEKSKTKLKSKSKSKSVSKKLVSSKDRHLKNLNESPEAKVRSKNKTITHHSGSGTPQVKKMTKQQYMEYLKEKNGTGVSG